MSRIPSVSTMGWLSSTEAKVLYLVETFVTGDPHQSNMKREVPTLFNIKRKYQGDKNELRNAITMALTAILVESGIFDSADVVVDLYDSGADGAGYELYDVVVKISVVDDGVPHTVSVKSDKWLK